MEAHGSLMLKHHAHSGTDVTGFGILGHAQNLMENQQEAVGMEIHTLPCIANTVKKVVCLTVDY